MTRNFLLLKHIKVESANASANMLITGFPAITSFLGFMKYLQIIVNSHGLENITFNKIAISCHEFELLTHNNSIINYKKPMKQNGQCDSLIDDVRCNFDVSLLIEFSSNKSLLTDKDDNIFRSIIENEFQLLSIAGGHYFNRVNYEILACNDDVKERKIINKLMLGNVIIDRHDLLMNDISLNELLIKYKHFLNYHSNDDITDTLSKFLAYNFIHVENGESSNFVNNKKGWIVPISVGYKTLVRKNVKSQRDTTKQHVFVEPISTLGEFVIACKCKHLDDILWEYKIKNDKYLCVIEKKEND